MTSFDKNKYLMAIRSKNWYHPTKKDIESWLQRNNIDFRPSKDSSIRINNPDGDTKFSAAIYTDTAYFKDFRPNHSQYNGSFVKFVSNYKNISIMESIKDISGSNKIITGYQEFHGVNEEDEKENEDIIKLPNGALNLKNTDGKIKDIVMNYLINERSLSESIIYKSNVHHLGTRMLFPYYMYDMIVFYQFRDLMNKRFEFPLGNIKSAGDYIYGFDNVEPCSEVIVVESIFNALSISHGAVATGGASLKPGQIKAIKALNPTSIILAPDNDEAGIKSISSDYHELKKITEFILAKEIYYCIPPLKYKGTLIKDWNEMIQKGGDPYKYINDNKRLVNSKLLFEGIKAV